MKSKALLVFVLTLAFQLNAPASPVLNAKLSCSQIQSDVFLIIQVKNDGPDTVIRNTKVYYWYKLASENKRHYGSFNLPETLSAGQYNNHNIEGTQGTTQAAECGVSLKPFRGQH